MSVSSSIDQLAIQPTHSVHHSINTYLPIYFKSDSDQLKDFFFAHILDVPGKKFTSSDASLQLNLK